ncbi:hypothetical protein ACWDV4_19940 [Micromonospora sp. NPDC003197]
MALLALAHPLWSAVRRSMRVLTGLTMATLLLALGVGGGTVEPGQPPTPSTVQSASMALTAQVTDVVFVSHSGAAIEQSQPDAVDDDLPVGNCFSTANPAPADSAPQRPSTLAWEPSLGSSIGAIGQRAPPRA